jgi:hypothetical protein
MGRSYTPKYAIQLDTQASMAWDVKAHGTPNAANLQRYVMAYAKSLEVGGVNAHISQALGYVPYPRRAVIRYNKPGGAVVAEWRAAMFQVYG